MVSRPADMPAATVGTVFLIRLMLTSSAVLRKEGTGYDKINVENDRDWCTDERRSDASAVGAGSAYVRRAAFFTCLCARGRRRGPWWGRLRWRRLWRRRPCWWRLWRRRLWRRR